MKVFSKKSITISALILIFSVFSAPQAAQANRSYVIDEFTIKYYKSLLEAKELSKPIESRIDYYTTRSGEEKFAGYKYGKLDDSFAYENRTSRGIYRGKKGTRRSTAMTNYHTAALADPSIAAFQPKTEETTEAVEEIPDTKLLRASALKPRNKVKKAKTNKSSLRNIMMSHGVIHKKQ